MKKQITITFLLLSCFLFGACGRKPASSSSSDVAGTEPSHATQAAASEDTETAKTTKSAKSSEAQPASDIVEDGKILYFEVSPPDKDGEWGLTMHASMENRSDRDLMISLGNVSINGVMAPPYWSETVNAGMKAQSDIVWAADTLSEKGIDDVSQIQFELIAYDDDNPDGYLVDVNHTVYPNGKDRAKTETYERSEGDQILFDDENCSMIITGKDPDGEWGYTLKACLVNKTDRGLMFASADVSVNDVMCDPSWSESVAAGTISRCRIIWPKEELQNAGIQNVTGIKLPVGVYDDENYEEVRAEKSYDINS